MVSCAKQFNIITAYLFTQGKRRILALKILDARQEVEAEAISDLSYLIFRLRSSLNMSDLLCRMELNTGEYFFYRIEEINNANGFLSTCKNYFQLKI